MKVNESKLAAATELIYVSLGTVCNTDVEPFILLIEGIKAINRSAPDNRYKFLMSVGDQCHEKFQMMSKNKEIEIPSNLLIMPRVPLLDVLKRASLFITHSGQGSTADELGLGVQLDFDTMNSEAIKKACTTVLNDKSYLERAVLFSQLSRKYKGTQEANRITLEFLQNAPKIKSN